MMSSQCKKPSHIFDTLAESELKSKLDLSILDSKIRCALYDDYNQFVKKDNLLAEKKINTFASQKKYRSGYECHDIQSSDFSKNPNPNVLRDIKNFDDGNEIASNKFQKNYFVITEWCIKLEAPSQADLSPSVFIIGNINRENRILLWQTTAISSRIDAHHVRTKSGTIYFLKGIFSLSRYRENNLSYSSSFISQFENGFPINWESLCIEEFNNMQKKDTEKYYESTNDYKLSINPSFERESLENENYGMEVYTTPSKRNLKSVEFDLDQNYAMNEKRDKKFFNMDNNYTNSKYSKRNFEIEEIDLNTSLVGKKRVRRSAMNSYANVNDMGKFVENSDPIDFPTGFCTEKYHPRKKNKMVKVVYVDAADIEISTEEDEEDEDFICEYDEDDEDDEILDYGSEVESRSNENYEENSVCDALTELKRDDTNFKNKIVFRNDGIVDIDNWEEPVSEEEEEEFNNTNDEREIDDDLLLSVRYRNENVIPTDLEEFIAFSDDEASDAVKYEYTNSLKRGIKSMPYKRVNAKNNGAFKNFSVPYMDKSANILDDGYLNTRPVSKLVSDSDGNINEPKEPLIQKSLTIDQKVNECNVVYKHKFKTLVDFELPSIIQRNYQETSLEQSDNKINVIEYNQNNISEAYQNGQNFGEYINEESNYKMEGNKYSNTKTKADDSDRHVKIFDDNNAIVVTTGTTAADGVTNNTGGSSWTAEQEEMLLKACKVCDPTSAFYYKELASYIPGKTVSDVEMRLTHVKEIQGELSAPKQKRKKDDYVLSSPLTIESNMKLLKNKKKLRHMIQGSKDLATDAFLSPSFKDKIELIKETALDSDGDSFIESKMEESNKQPTSPSAIVEVEKNEYLEEIRQADRDQQDKFISRLSKNRLNGKNVAATFNNNENKKKGATNSLNTFKMIREMEYSAKMYRARQDALEEEMDKTGDYAEDLIPESDEDENTVAEYVL